ncbi:hypothetical protein JTE90_026805 [Oedothorax gibbosus]|uniref:Uncharacterized protein n=1 Tax=Oedothorax gibbosus TaxID=931172 RepID=A0AAV6UQ21_9ARAC|nr:hypothetical protein JTE90_026805 [Oedothorax gibbosus]
MLGLSRKEASRTRTDRSKGDSTSFNVHSEEARVNPDENELGRFKERAQKHKAACLNRHMKTQQGCSQGYIPRQSRIIQFQSSKKLRKRNVLWYGSQAVSVGDVRQLKMKVIIRKG